MKINKIKMVDVMCPSCAALYKVKETTQKVHCMCGGLIDLMCGGLIDLNKDLKKEKAEVFKIFEQFGLGASENWALSQVVALGIMGEDSPKDIKVLKSRAPRDEQGRWTPAPKKLKRKFLF